MYNINKMSIIMLPYISKYKHTGMKIYHAKVLGGMVIGYRTSNNAPETEQIMAPLNDDEWGQLHRIILDADDGFQYSMHDVRHRTYIFQDFANIIQRITNTFTVSIWKTLKACPLLTIREVLCLKVDDIDSRVDHTEKMLIQFQCNVEDQLYHTKKKLIQFQCKMDVLEKSQAENNVKNRQLIEENELLQCKMDALEKLQAENNVKNRQLIEEKLLQYKMDARKEYYKMLVILTFIYILGICVVLIN